MQWPSLVVSVRHGESIGNRDFKNDLSKADRPNHRFHLTEKGIAQAKQAGRYLEETYGKFDVFFVSTFMRTHETMKYLAPYATRHEIEEDARLDEVWKGVHYEITRELVEKDFPHENAREKREGNYHYRATGGESLQDVECRIRSFLLHLQLNYPNRRVLIAGHRYWTCVYHKVLKNLRAAEFDLESPEYKNVWNCSVTDCRPVAGRLMIKDFARCVA